MDENHMWLDEDSPVVPSGTNLLSKVRRAGVIGVAAGCLAVVALPLSVALSGTGQPQPKHHHDGGKTTILGNGSAEHEVIGALSATTDSGNFDFTYHLSSTQPTTSTTVPPTTAPSGTAFTMPAITSTTVTPASP